LKLFRDKALSSCVAATTTIVIRAVNAHNGDGMITPCLSCDAGGGARAVSRSVVCRSAVVVAGAATATKA